MNHLHRAIVYKEVTHQIVRRFNAGIECKNARCAGGLPISRNCKMAPKSVYIVLFQIP